jgi:hypothetical protein
MPKFLGAPKPSHPEDFSFPRSFEFNALVAIVSRNRKSESFKVQNSAQSTIFDAENNRVKIHRINKIFREVDNEVHVYDFDQMRLLVSDPTKQMCIKLEIANLSPFTAKTDPAPSK